MTGRAIPAMVAAGVFLAVLAPASTAQLRNYGKPDTPPQFAGGYAFGACRYPKPAQDAGLSGCCNMTLDIDAQGHVTRASGECTDPVFLQPTRRCLSIQKFIPATKGGKPVSAVHKLEYEWRSSAPYDKNMCKRLGVS